MVQSRRPVPTTRRVLRRPASALVRPGAQKQPCISASIKTNVQKKTAVRSLAPKKHNQKATRCTLSKKKVRAHSAAVASAQKVREATARGTPAPTTPKARARVEPSTPPKKVKKVMIKFSKEALNRKKLQDEALNRKKLRDEDLIRKKLQDEMLRVCQGAIDPIAALRKKYEKMIPKRPLSPYHLFIADDANQKRARELLKDADRTVDPSINQHSQLADMWKSLAAAQKAPYEQKHAMEKAIFDKTTKVWQQTEVFQKIDLLERKQKEAKISEKRAEKEAEEKEILDFLEGGVKAKPARGLRQGRRAVITGVEAPDSLNGKHVILGEFVKATDRWVVKPVDISDVDPVWPLHVQPAHLIWTALAKHAKKAEQRQKEEARKKEQREVEKAAKEEQRQQEEVMKRVQRDIDHIAKVEENEARRAFRQSELQAVKDVHKALQDSAKEERRNAEMAARAIKENQDGLQRAMNEATKAAIRAFESKAPQQSASDMHVAMAEAECLD